MRNCGSDVLHKSGIAERRWRNGGFDVLRKAELLNAAIGILQRVEKQIWFSLEKQTAVHCVLEKPSPLAFPLFVDRLRERLSSETLEDRLKRMAWA